MLMVGQNYVGPVKESWQGKEKIVMEEPVLLPDKAIWHPVAPNMVFETNDETVRLSARTKLLNPKFYEGMLSMGYEDVREIQKRLRKTMGWSATAGEVDNFVFEDANTVFIDDQEMQQRLLDTNPNAFCDIVTTFLEANGRGYWDKSDDNIERLQELYAEVEASIEGV